MITGAVGTAVMDPRLRARRVEVNRARGRRRLRRLLVGVVLTVVVLLGYAVVRSPLLDVDQIEVSGLTAAETTVVEEALADLHRKPMVSLDPAAVAERLEAMAWVDEVEVARHWPGTLAVVVRARVPVARVGDGPTAVAVDGAGRVLGPVGARDLPAIEASEAVPEPGSVLGTGDRSLASVLARLPDEIRPEVVAARGHEPAITLVLRDGIEVVLGDGNRLRAKAVALSALLDQAGRDTMATIDVSAAPASSTLTRVTKERA